jgi:hypothetical protein
MNERRTRRIGAILLMLLIAAIVGAGAYRMGVAQGLALGMAQVEGGREAVYSHAWHAHGWYGYPGPWGFGFGFGFLVPLLFFFLFVTAMRMLYWHGRRGPWGRGGRGGGGWGGSWHPRHPHRRWRDDDRDFRRDDYSGDDPRSCDDDWHRRATTL